MACRRVSFCAKRGCPSGPAIIDLVAYGTTANCREGVTTADNAPGPANNTTSTQRKQAACQDANNNLSDFATAAVNPRNTAAVISQCSCSTSYISMLNLSNDWSVKEHAGLAAACRRTVRKGSAFPERIVHLSS